MTYVIKVFKLGTSISTNPHEVIQYLTLKSTAKTMADLGIEIKRTLKSNGYEGYNYMCTLQIRTANTKK